MGKGSFSAVNLLNEARRGVLDKPGIKQEKVSSKGVKELLAMHTRMHAHTCTYIRTHTHTHTHTYVRIYMRTYVHIRNLTNLSMLAMYATLLY